MKLKPQLTIALIAALTCQASLALEGVNTKIINPEDLALKIKPEQLSRIKAISQDIDLQIKNAFKGEEALQNEMQADLNNIVKMTDESAKRAAVSAYQSKYKNRYQAVLAKGKVNLADVATRLNGAVPEMQFSLNPDMSFKGTLKKIAPDAFSTSDAVSPNAPTAESASTKKSTAASTNTQPTPAQISTVKNLVTQDYVITKDLGCGGVAGSEIAVSGGFMTNKSTAIALGDCTNDGEYIHTFEVQRGQKVKVDVTYDLTGSAFVSGLLGAGSYSSAHVSIRNILPRNYINYDREYTINNCSVVSILYWPASATCEVLGGVIHATITKPGTYKFKASTHTNQIAAVGGAYGESRIKKLRVTLTTSPE